MPICEECGDEFSTDLAELYDNRADIERLYRAVADREPQREIMQMIYDIFGDSCGLRPPVAELNLARKCAVGGSGRG